MRPGKGCESCRERHLKCVTEKGSSSCTRCLEGDRECNFGPKYRFKLVSRIEAGSNGGKKQELRYAKDQVWVRTRKNCSFILEDGSGLEYGVPDDDDEEMPTAIPLQSEPVTAVLAEPIYSGIPPRRAISVDAVSRPVTAPEHDFDSGLRQYIPSLSNILSPPLPPPLANRSGTGDTPRSLDIQFQPQITPHARIASTAALDFASPASIEELTKRHDDGGVSSPNVSYFPVGSIDGTSPASLPTPGGIPRPSLTRREAYLVQHFINKIGPWMDVCDLACHMTHELPRRAMQKPMVLYSILAVGSRHLALWANQPEPAEAQFYHGKCLKLVIEQLAGPESLYDDNLLATVVALRIYEEIEHSTDMLLHLQGASRLLRAIPSFAYSGGLGEAACWQCIRQDIYICLKRSVPPNFRLEDFEQSSAFTFRDDGACANIIILIFAKILRLTFTESEKGNTAAWDRLELDVAAWNDRRSRLFQPIYYEDLDTTQDRPFPVVQLICAPQVAAVQYHAACKIFLLLHKPQTEAISGFHASKRRRKLERDVTYHLAAIIGIAESNPFVENANFTAHHLLRHCGFSLTNKVQRERAVDFLEQTERILGWSTAPTIALLKNQWEDLDSDDG